MNLKDLLRNKRLMLGVGGAAAVGLVVLILRKRGGGAGGDAGEAASAAGGGSTTMQPGTYDSTGSDVYNGLQALYAGQDARWTELVKVLGEVQSKLPTTPASSTPTTPKPTVPPASTTGTVARKVNYTIQKGIPASNSWAGVVQMYYKGIPTDLASLRRLGEALRKSQSPAIQKYASVAPNFTLTLPTSLRY